MGVLSMTIMTGNAVQTDAGRTILNSTGNVIQCVQVDSTSIWVNSNTRNTEYDMVSPFGDGSLSITPTYSGNRLLFMSTMHMGNGQTWRSTAFRTYYRIGSGGSWVNFSGGFGGITWSNTSGTCIAVWNQFLLPTLNTTSTVYFKLTFVEHADGGDLRLNDNNNSGSLGSNLANANSNMTVWEISA